MAIQGGKKQLFNNASQASCYADYRPNYPPHLFDTILEFASLPAMDLAVDLGCGTGQATTELAKRFKLVIGVDPSPAQLSQAPQLHNAEFREGPAEATGLPSCSADLITIAQALHWLDLPAFYKEVVRVLKPHGALAAWGYDLNKFDIPEADKVLEEFYEGVLGAYWDEGRRKVEQHYIGMEPPPGTFDSVERINLDMYRETSLAGLMGYLRSWSAYATYRKQHPDAPDPLDELNPKMASALGCKSDDDPVKMRYPVFAILAKCPLGA